MDANQAAASPRSSANKKPWENLIGMSPEGTITFYGGAEKGPRETQQWQGQGDVCGNLRTGLGSGLPVEAGGWEWRVTSC